MSHEFPPPRRPWTEARQRYLASAVLWIISLSLSNFPTFSDSNKPQLPQARRKGTLASRQRCLQIITHLRRVDLNRLFCEVSFSRLFSLFPQLERESLKGSMGQGFGFLQVQVGPWGEIQSWSARAGFLPSRVFPPRLAENLGLLFGFSPPQERIIRSSF